MKIRASRSVGSHEAKSGVLRTKVRQVQTFSVDIKVSELSQEEAQVIRAHRDDMSVHARIRLQMLEEGHVGQKDGKVAEGLKVEVLERDLPGYHLKLSAGSPAVIEETLGEVLEHLKQVMIGVRLVEAYIGGMVLESEL